MLFETSRNPVSNTSSDNTEFLKHRFVPKQFMCLGPNSFLVYVYLYGFFPKANNANGRKTPTADS